MPCLLAHQVGTTGVEMEALTATSVAALTVYDMCKAVSKVRSRAKIAPLHHVPPYIAATPADG